MKANELRIGGTYIIKPAWGYGTRIKIEITDKTKTSICYRSLDFKNGNPVRVSLEYFDSRYTVVELIN